MLLLMLLMLHAAHEMRLRLDLLLHCRGNSGDNGQA